MRPYCCVCSLPGTTDPLYVTFDSFFRACACCAAGSLVGSAVTAMVTCLSPSPRNGAESFLSCKYSKDMARMQNDPKPQPNVPYKDMVAAAQKGLAKSQAIVKKGVAGKYQKKRMAEVAGFETTLRILEQLGGGGEVEASGGSGNKK